MIHSFLEKFVKEEDGQDTVEYSLFLAFLGLAAVAALGLAKTSLHILWSNAHLRTGAAHLLKH